MARVSNRQILEALTETRSLLSSNFSEAVGSSFSDPLAAAYKLNGKEFFGLDDVREAATKCYECYHGNPLFRRAVNIRAQYIFGRGVSIDSPQAEVKAAIVDFLARNARALGHQGRMEMQTTAMLDGNLFLLCQTDDMGAVTVRQVPLDEIVGSLRDPDDYRTVWYWKRTYLEYPKKADGTYGVGASVTKYYPALGHEVPASDRLEKIDGIPVVWTAPIHHAPLPRVGRELFAMPPFISALPWATAYSHFLSNIASIAAALARFAWKATAKTPAGARALKTAMGTGTGDRIPTASTLTSTEGVTLEPVKTSGVTTNADEGERFMLMFASGTDTPGHLLSCNPDTGNLATTKTMERPFELAVLDGQRWWEDLIETLVTYAVRCRVVAEGFLPLQGVAEIDDYGRKRVMVTVTRTNDDGAQEPALEEAIVAVTFPSVLEHDMVQEVAAIIDAATLKGLSPAGVMDTATLQRLLLSALNIADPDDAIADMDQEDIAAQTGGGTQQPEEPAFEPPGGFQPDATAEALEDVAKALRGIVEAAEVTP
jgi:hypothetical protein